MSLQAGQCKAANFGDGLAFVTERRASCPPERPSTSGGSGLLGVQEIVARYGQPATPLTNPGLSDPPHFRQSSIKQSREIDVMSYPRADVRLEDLPMPNGHRWWAERTTRYLTSGGGFVVVLSLGALLTIEDRPLPVDSGT